ncbi:Exc2 family lipoprotein [Edwardsiella tarda]|uniref:Exc2 family lipoprotein n=1 Tax=Edwardsiella tarda TaxID=636 RepID=UPI003D2EDD9F
MKGHARSLYLTLLLSTITLTACTPHQSSVERHTRHYVYTSDDAFDPNFYIHKTDTTKMLIPFFQQFWDMGAKDKAAGISPEEAKQRIKYYQSVEFLNSLKKTSLFAGREYADNDPIPAKEAKLFTDTISKVYFDGYEGKK